MYQVYAYFELQLDSATEFSSTEEIFALPIELGKSYLL